MRGTLLGLCRRLMKKKSRRTIKEIMGFAEMEHDAIYLGNSFVFSRNKTKEFMKLKEKTIKQLEGWSSQTLLKVRKVAMIKNVVQAIPIYTMFTFKVPKGVCTAMDSAVRSYWWSGKADSKNFTAWKSWTDICKPKEIGGLGFRLFTDMNQALLAKLTWNLAVDEEELWV